MVVKQFDEARMDSMMEVTLDSAVLLPEPPPEAMRLEAVLSALGDPVRLQIVRQLHEAGTPKACGTFGLPVGKSTASHHFKVLRESGLTERLIVDGQAHQRLRLDEVGERYPGLLDTVIKALDD